MKLKTKVQGIVKRPDKVPKVQKSIGFALLSLFLLIEVPGSLWAESLEGYVFSVHDGDTVWVMDAEDERHKVRLAGIDAPEVKQVGGNAATRALAEFVAGKYITVEYYKRDRYKRLVGKILLDDQDICAQMVATGHAWHFTKYAREQSAKDRELYAELEEEARKVKHGLWEEANPLPPWEWRKR